MDDYVISTQGSDSVLEKPARMREREKVAALFDRLLAAERTNFPKPYGQLKAPYEHGVYVIYGPGGAVMYVGRTYRGILGLYRRLKNHSENGLAFLKKERGSFQREFYSFRCLAVKSDRLRALLEFYATGRLCPKHFEHSGVKLRARRIMRKSAATEPSSTPIPDEGSPAC